MEQRGRLGCSIWFVWNFERGRIVFLEFYQSDIGNHGNVLEMRLIDVSNEDHRSTLKQEPQAGKMILP